MIALVLIIRHNEKKNEIRDHLITFLFLSVKRFEKFTNYRENFIRFVRIQITFK